LTSSHNRIAGQRVERPAALSDGVFAVAMILLLDLRAPAAEAIQSEPGTWAGPGGAGFAAGHVHPQLHEPGHFLDRAADATESPGPL